MVVGAIDISKDPLVVRGFELRELFPGVARWTNLVLVSLIGVMIVCGAVAALVGQPKVPRQIATFVLLFLMTSAYGVVVGVVQGNDFSFVVGDAAYSAVYVVLFALVSCGHIYAVNALRRIVILVGAIVATKYAIVICLNALSGVGLDWRYSVKFSFAYLPLAMLGMAYLMNGRAGAEWRLGAIVFLMALIGLVLSNTRGYYIGFVGGLFFLTVALRPAGVALRVLGVVSIAACAAFFVGAMARDDAAVAFGAWSGTSTFDEGLQYRKDQLAMLMRMFDRNPLFGSGLGAFDPAYEGYEPWLPRPYIVELEYVNLVVKLGPIVGMILFLNFVLLTWHLGRLIRVARATDSATVIAGATGGMVALVLAGGTNSIYSSVYFHIYVVLLLAAASSVKQPVFVGVNVSGR